MKLVLLPGMDGTGKLFEPLLVHLGPELQPVIVEYPADPALGYDGLLPLVLGALPTEGPFAVLGESFSGPLAVMAAASRPTGLAALVLCASFVRAPIGGLLRVLRPLVRAPAFRVVSAGLRRRMLLGGLPDGAIAAAVEDVLATIPAAVLAARIRAVLAVDVSREVQGLSVPILYLAGAQDFLVSHRSVDLICCLAPGVQVVTLEAPHLVLQTAPAAAATVLQSFLRAVAARRSL